MMLSCVSSYHWIQARGAGLFVQIYQLVSVCVIGAGSVCVCHRAIHSLYKIVIIDNYWALLSLLAS